MRSQTLLITLIILLISSFYSFGQSDMEKDAIKNLISEAYVDGLLNQGNLEATKNGFFPGFNLLIYDSRNNTVNKLPIYNWIKSVETRKKQNPSGPEHKTSVKFLNIDITGNASVAKIELYKNNKHIYTDYLSLYKFNEGWKIVGKIFLSHQ